MAAGMTKYGSNGLIGSGWQSAQCQQWEGGKGILEIPRIPGGQCANMLQGVIVKIQY